MIYRYLLLFGVGIGFGLLLSWPLFGSPPTTPTPIFANPVTTPSSIQLAHEADILTKRTQLIHFIWGEAGFPTGIKPDIVTEMIEDNRYADLTNLKQINRLVISMPVGINSIGYHFIPQQSNNQLMIYHQGHKGDFVAGKTTIQQLLNSGYAVIGLTMPLLGMNSQPIISLPRFGDMKLTHHNQLSFVVLEQGHPLQFFLHPIAVSLTYAEDYSYEQLHMMGISGGGWATVVYSALDSRIDHSYPVAGSLPLSLRVGADEWGDYEQSLPDFYALANYYELYLMGAHGKGRKQIHLFNQYEPCCFAGTRFELYEIDIQQRLSQLGDGTYGVYLDNSHNQHKISEIAMLNILKQLRSSIEIVPSPDPINFGQMIQLRDLYLNQHQLKPGETILISLHWRALTVIPQVYTFFIHLIDDDGQVVAQVDTIPRQGTRPTTTWEASEQLADQIALPLPIDIPMGDYTLLGGWYDWETGERLSLNNEMLDNTTVLGQISIQR